MVSLPLHQRNLQLMREHGGFEDFEVSVASDARTLAVKQHGDQRYGQRPYVDHLDAVVNLLLEYESNTRATLSQCLEGFAPLHIRGYVLRAARAELLDAVCAGYLHDTVEDTGLTTERIERTFNSRVATWVWALSASLVGGSRKDRWPTVAQHINTLGIWPAKIKVMDRTANVRAAIADRNGGFAQMYLSEHVAFRQGLPVARECCDRILTPLLPALWEILHPTT